MVSLAQELFPDKRQLQRRVSKLERQPDRWDPTVAEALHNVLRSGEYSANCCARVMLLLSQSVPHAPADDHTLIDSLWAAGLREAEKAIDHPSSERALVEACVKLLDSLGTLNPAYVASLLPLESIPTGSTAKRCAALIAVASVAEYVTDTVPSTAMLSVVCPLVAEQHNCATTHYFALSALAAIDEYPPQVMRAALATLRSPDPRPSRVREGALAIVGRGFQAFMACDDLTPENRSVGEALGKALVEACAWDPPCVNLHPAIQQGAGVMTSAWSSVAAELMTALTVALPRRWPPSTPSSERLQHTAALWTAMVVDYHCPNKDTEALRPGLAAHLAGWLEETLPTEASDLALTRALSSSTTQLRGEILEAHLSTIVPWLCAAVRLRVEPPASEVEDSIESHETVYTALSALWHAVSRAKPTVARRFEADIVQSVWAVVSLPFPLVHQECLPGPQDEIATAADLIGRVVAAEEVTDQESELSATVISNILALRQRGPADRLRLLHAVLEKANRATVRSACSAVLGLVHDCVVEATESLDAAEKEQEDDSTSESGSSEAGESSDDSAFVVFAVLFNCAKLLEVLLSKCGTTHEDVLPSMMHLATWCCRLENPPIVKNAGMLLVNAMLRQAPEACRGSFNDLATAIEVHVRAFSSAPPAVLDGYTLLAAGSMAEALARHVPQPDISSADFASAIRRHVVALLGGERLPASSCVACLIRVAVALPEGDGGAALVGIVAPHFPLSLSTTDDPFAPEQQVEVTAICDGVREWEKQRGGASKHRAFRKLCRWAKEQRRDE